MTGAVDRAASARLRQKPDGGAFLPLIVPTITAMELALVLVGLLVLSAVVAIVVRHRLRRRNDLAVQARLAKYKPYDPTGGGSHGRRNRAVERELAVAPTPADLTVTTLVAQVRDRYKVGKDNWNANAAGVLRELTDAGHTGLMAALWIVERSYAGFIWELDFWTSEAGLSAPVEVRDGFAALPSRAQPNPYNSPSGYHPRIHLVAALEVLAEQPQPEATTQLTGLLEYWFAYAEHELQLRGVDVTVLHSLVRCYQATPTTTHPEFLTRLANKKVIRPVVDYNAAFSHVTGGITYVKRVVGDRGKLDLGALARAASNR